VSSGICCAKLKLSRNVWFGKLASSLIRHLHMPRMSKRDNSCTLRIEEGGGEIFADAKNVSVTIILIPPPSPLVHSRVNAKTEEKRSRRPPYVGYPMVGNNGEIDVRQ